jgi:hypothetical protein
MPPARAQALCDDVENAVGDVLCDGFDELEAILAAEETVALAPEKIREVRVPRQPAPRAPALAVALTRARPQGVDRVMYKFQKHAVDNCRVFKSYSLQQIFGISPQVAERSRAPAGLQPSAPGVHTSEEEQAIDAELAQLRERAHAVRRPTRIALVVSPRAGFLTARARFCSQMPRWTACSKRRARCRSSWSRAPSAWSGSLRSRAAVRASLWRLLARHSRAGGCGAQRRPCRKMWRQSPSRLMRFGRWWRASGRGWGRSMEAGRRLRRVARAICQGLWLSLRRTKPQLQQRGGTIFRS